MVMSVVVFVVVMSVFMCVLVFMPMSVVVVGVRMFMLGMMMFVLMIMIVVTHVHIELHTFNSRLLRACAVQMEAFEFQCAQLAFEIAEFHAKIEQRSEEHVPANAAERVEIKRFHPS